MQYRQYLEELRLWLLAVSHWVAHCTGFGFCGVLGLCVRHMIRLLFAGEVNNGVMSGILVALTSRKQQASIQRSQYCFLVSVSL